MFINLEKFIKKDENIKNKISEILNKCGSTYKIEEYYRNKLNKEEIYYE